jgi:hypothetical protein
MLPVLPLSVIPKIYQPKRKFSQKNWIGAKNSYMGRNLQAQPKILKKLSEHQINQSEQKYSQKKYV